MLTFRPGWQSETELVSELWNSDGTLRMPIINILASAAPAGQEDELVDFLLSLVEDMEAEGRERSSIAREILKTVFGSLASDLDETEREFDDSGAGSSLQAAHAGPDGVDACRIPLSINFLGEQIRVLSAGTAPSSLEWVDLPPREIEVLHPHHYERNRTIIAGSNPSSTNQNPCLMSEAHPIGRMAAYIYDDDGSPPSGKDRESSLTGYGYDLRDRQASKIKANDELFYKRVADGGTTRCAYDAMGRITSAEWIGADSGTLILFTNYDQALECALFHYSDARHKDIADGLYIYDADGRITSICSPDGSITHSSYDVAGRQLGKNEIGSKKDGSVRGKYAHDVNWSLIAGVANPLAHYSFIWNLTQSLDLEICHQAVFLDEVPCSGPSRNAETVTYIVEWLDGLSPVNNSTTVTVPYIPNPIAYNVVSIRMSGDEIGYRYDHFPGREANTTAGEFSREPMFPWTHGESLGRFPKLVRNEPLPDYRPAVLQVKKRLRQPLIYFNAAWLRLINESLRRAYQQAPDDNRI